MEAKDTVMSPEEIERVSSISRYDKSSFRKVAATQAEISFKAGMKRGVWLFAWWKDGVQYVGTSGKTLAEVYKELGIS